MADLGSITQGTSGTSGTGAKTFRAACITEHKNKPEWSKICDKVRYLAYAEETCPTTQKRHFQAFAYAHDKMRLTDWKKLFPTAHIEQMYRSFESNETYYSKEGQLIEVGKRPAQGWVHTDLLDVKKLLDEGKRPLEVADEHEEHFSTVIKYRSGLNDYSV
jgi:hypothetical protein